MYYNDTQQMMLTIIEHAQTAKPSEFHLIRNWKEYRYYKGKRRSFKLLTKALRKGVDRLLTRYCDSVATGKENFNTLVAYQQMVEVLTFYERELATVTGMIYEYEAYLFEGNYVSAFLGEIRSDADMHDFRE